MRSSPDARSSSRETRRSSSAACRSSQCSSCTIIIFGNRGGRGAAIWCQGRHRRARRRRRRLEPVRAERQAKHCQEFFGIHRFVAEGSKPIPPGKHQLRLEFKYDGGGASLRAAPYRYVEGKKDGAGSIERTVPMLFSADETCDVGKETGSTV